MQVDLCGRCFDIPQTFLDKYQESIISKYRKTMPQNGQMIEIDRHGKYFSTILDYANDERSVKFSQMSHISIEKLMREAEFFIIEDLVEKCKQELKIYEQRNVVVVDDYIALKKKLADETRLVIILDYKTMLALEAKQSMIQRALKLVDRDACLIIGCRGQIEGYNYRDEDLDGAWFVKWSSFLFDPSSNKILKAFNDTDEGKLLKLIYCANSLYPYSLDWRFRDDDPEERWSDLLAVESIQTTED